ncbi:hypothetical protein [Streptomyces regalis]|uniref:hypothetical protein n=1 Tax=Streptomyces regalis TaxID=68262 RepID=UPI00131CA954|nr:hypothetical protein [Streptomyces regalis]
MLERTTLGAGDAVAGELTRRAKILVGDVGADGVFFGAAALANPVGALVGQSIAAIGKAVQGGLYVDGRISLDDAELSFLGNRSNVIFFGRRVELTLRLDAIEEVSARRLLGSNTITISKQDGQMKIVVFDPNDQFVIALRAAVRHARRPPPAATD